MQNQIFTLTFLVAVSGCDSSKSTSNDAVESSSDPDASIAQQILPLGDSITAGFPFTYRYPLYNQLTEQNYLFDFVGSHTNGAWEYPESGWDQDNEGWPGWTTSGIEERLTDWSSDYTVDLALIHLGTNDAREGDVEESVVAMTSIVEQLRANNASVSICMAQIIPYGILEEEGTSTTELNAFVDDWNSRLATLVSDMTTAQSPIVLVDMNSDFGDSDLDDGIHPTHAGVEKMADKWLECIFAF